MCPVAKCPAYFLISTYGDVSCGEMHIAMCHVAKCSEYFLISTSGEVSCGEVPYGDVSCDEVSCVFPYVYLCAVIKFVDLFLVWSAIPFYVS